MLQRNLALLSVPAGSSAIIWKVLGSPAPPANVKKASDRRQCFMIKMPSVGRLVRLMKAGRMGTRTLG